MPTLDLPDTPRSAVWRALVAQLRADPVLAAVIRTWRIPDGRDTEVWASIEDDAQAPALRLVPDQGPMDWYDASAQKGALTIDIEAYIGGHDAEDYLNLQGAIESAVYPDDGGAFQRALVALGAETGLVMFDRPLAEASKTQRPGGFRLMGTIRVDVLRALIP